MEPEKVVLDIQLTLCRVGLSAGVAVVEVMEEKAEWVELAEDQPLEVIQGVEVVEADMDLEEGMELVDLKHTVLWIKEEAVVVVGEIMERIVRADFVVAAVVVILAVGGLEGMGNKTVHKEFV